MFCFPHTWRGNVVTLSVSTQQALLPTVTGNMLLRTFELSLTASSKFISLTVCSEKCGFCRNREIFPASIPLFVPKLLHNFKFLVSSSPHFQCSICDEFISCCTTNYPELNVLKQHIFIISQFLWFKDLGMVSSYFWVSHKAAVKCISWREGHMWRLNWGKNLLWNWHGCWQNSVSWGLLDWGPRFLSSCWLMTALDSLAESLSNISTWLIKDNKKEGLLVKWKSQPYVTSSWNGHPIIFVPLYRLEGSHYIQLILQVGG